MHMNTHAWTGVGKKVMLATLSLAIFLGGTEAGIRAFSRYSYQMQYYTRNPYEHQFLDNVYSWEALRPIMQCPLPPGKELNGFVINSRGFYSPEYAYAKKPGVRRIVLLGDSYAAGVIGYRNTFIRLLERHLNETDSGHTYEIVNLGYPCIGTSVELKILELEGLKYHPDLIIESVFVGNDEFDAVYNRTMEEKSRNITIAPYPELYYRSKFLTLIWRLMAQKKEKKGIAHIENTNGKVLGVYTGKNIGDESIPSFSDAEFTDIYARWLDIMNPESDLQATIPSMASDIAEMKKLSERSGAGFVVLLFPAEFQVNRTLLKEVSDASHRDIGSFEIDLPQTKLRSGLERNKISYIDYYPYLLADASSSSYFLPRDTHLNSAGNEAAERILFPWVWAYFNSSPADTNR